MKRRPTEQVSPFERRLPSRAVAAGLLGSMVFLASSTRADQATEMSVPVKMLTTPEPVQQVDPTMIMREAAPQATPAARMPQYQLHHQDLSYDDDVESSKLRFLLALADRPLLMEASITIDGKPFRQAREQRVQEILKYIADPVAFRAEQLRIETAKAAAGNASSLLETFRSVVAGIASIGDAITADNAVTTNDADAPEASTPKTAEPVEASDAATDAAEKTDASETNDVPETSDTPDVPAVEPYVAPATIYDRIQRYTQATGQAPAADEVRWLLSNWIDGPVLLILNDNFQRFRADQKPVFQVLDRDRDGRVSVEELQHAVASFMECDLDRNDIVEATELAEVADDPRDKVEHASPGKLIFQIPNAATASTTYRRLAARYTSLNSETPLLPRFDPDHDGAFSGDEMQQLRDIQADLQLAINFDTTTPGSSRLIVTGFGSELSLMKDAIRLNPASVTLVLKDLKLELQAVQSAASDQVSVGAVNDGYSMLPDLDPNNDGRFSIRELRELNSRLKQFDLNQDGELSSDENHPTIRVCIGLGPTVHQSLALLRSVNTTSAASVQAGPEWFQQMDKNNDHDLTRKEFPGTDEQFRQLDRDNDELISAVEAEESLTP